MANQWTDEVMKRKEELIQDTESYCRLKVCWMRNHTSPEGPTWSWCEGSIGIYATNG